MYKPPLASAGNRQEETRDRTAPEGAGLLSGRTTAAPGRRWVSALCAVALRSELASARTCRRLQGGVLRAAIKLLTNNNLRGIMQL